MTPPRLDTPTMLATFDVRLDDDVSRVRRAVANHAETIGFGALDRTRLVTASSELARNLLTYGGGGEVLLERIDAPTVITLRVVFHDQGPGIADVEQALADGFSTGRGLGLGLGGARRLVESFEITSAPGGGTRVAIARSLPWVPPTVCEARTDRLREVSPR